MDAEAWGDHDDLDAFLEEHAGVLTEFETVAAAYALTLWQAWHHEEPTETLADGTTRNRTSQRAALQALQFAKTVLVFGGNRSGKTEMMRAALVALAIGSDHPVAQYFWQNNGCDPSHFPKGPGTCYIVALTHGDSLRYHRKQIDRLIPGASKWWSRDANAEARVDIEVPGYPTPATVWFKAEKQGEEGMQGDAVRAILHDEEGSTGAVWTEAGARLLDFDGWHLMSNTPLKGKTWVWERYVRQTPEGVRVFFIHTRDNPFIGARKAALLAEGDPDRAKARTEGVFEVVEGMIYEDWSRAVHLVEPFELDPAWPRLRVMDFGYRHPSVVLWACIGEDGQLVIYGEHHRAGWTLGQHAQVIHAIEGTKPPTREGEEPIADAFDAYREEWPADVLANVAALRELHDGAEVVFAWADSKHTQQIADLRRDHDITFRKAKKGWDVTRNAAAQRLKVRNGRPGVVVFKGRCPHFVEEIEAYRWGPRGERPLAVDDHCMDDFRYLSAGTRRM